MTPFDLPSSPAKMFSTTSNSTLAVLASLALLAFTACYYFPANLLRWLERKRYQYEVTFSLYMMTPTEKFIFSKDIYLCILLLLLLLSPSPPPFSFSISSFWLCSALPVISSPVSRVISMLTAMPKTQSSSSSSQWSPSPHPYTSPNTFPSSCVALFTTSRVTPTPPLPPRSRVLSRLSRGLLARGLLVLCLSCEWRGRIWDTWRWGIVL